MAWISKFEKAFRLWLLSEGYITSIEAIDEELSKEQIKQLRDHYRRLNRGGGLTIPIEDDF